MRQGENGVAVADLCREHGISRATYYDWRFKFGGMDVSLMSGVKAMADENRRLKKMYAELAMQNEFLKDALGIEAASALTVQRGTTNASGGFIG